jgi:hypothetical protein
MPVEGNGLLQQGIVVHGILLTVMGWQMVGMLGAICAGAWA